MRINVLGVGFDSVTAEEAVEYAMQLIDSGDSAYVVTPNPEIVWLCRTNAALANAVAAAALVLPDGVGITLGAKLLGTPLRARLPGIDFAYALIEALAKTGGSVFLLGAKPGVADVASIKLCEKFPGLVVSGTADGYFTDDGPVIEKISDTKPDLLLVCMGAPKQELWMAENLERLDARLCIGLGGALDVFAGTVKRAPGLMRRLGLEWLYRLILEPRRIKRMIKLPLFVFAVIWQRLRGKLAERE